MNHFVEQPNRGKRSVAIDTRTPDGLELLMKIVETADVFLTNLLPDSRERMGIDVDQIRARNPKIIYARGHGYGTKGELSEQGGFDLAAYWARGGIGDAYSLGDGSYPAIQRPAFGDVYGGLSIAAGIAGALLKRERTGEPSVVDVSLLNAAIWQLGPDIVGAGITGQDIPKFNLEEMPNPVASMYKTKDGRFIAFVLLQADRFWSDFCTRLGRTDLIDDERYANAAVRFRQPGRLHCRAAQDIRVRGSFALGEGLCRIRRGVGRRAYRARSPQRQAGADQRVPAAGDEHQRHRVRPGGQSRPVRRNSAGSGPGAGAR